MDLILRSGSGDKQVATGVIDSTGAYSFLGVANTGTGEVYYVRFGNPGGGSLRSWNSSSFAFGGGRAEAPRADLVDVGLGDPGNSLNTFQLPLTLNWSGRGQGDNYTVVISFGDGRGVALNSGDLGGKTAFTIAGNTLAPGEYFAEVQVRNGSGAGVSYRQFRFRVGSGGNLVPVGGGNSAATPTPQPSTAPAVGVGGGSINVTPTNRPNPLAPVNTLPGSTVGIGIASQPTPNPAVIGSPATAVPGVSGNTSGNSTGNGNGNSPGSNGTTLPPGVTGSGSLPASGGELPIAGLVLAALILGLRRIRLALQMPRLRF